MFFCFQLIFFNIIFSENPFRNTSIVSSSLDKGQVLHFVWPDLDPNCLQKSPADDQLDTIE